MDRWVDRWIDEWTYGWMDRWMNRWTDGWWEGRERGKERKWMGDQQGWTIPDFAIQTVGSVEIDGHEFPNCSRDRSIGYSKVSSELLQHCPKNRHSRDSYVLFLITEELIWDTLRPKDKAWVSLDQGLRPLMHLGRRYLWHTSTCDRAHEPVSVHD